MHTPGEGRFLPRPAARLRAATGGEGGTEDSPIQLHAICYSSEPENFVPHKLARKRIALPRLLIQTAEGYSLCDQSLYFNERAPAAIYHLLPPMHGNLKGFH